MLFASWKGRFRFTEAFEGTTPQQSHVPRVSTQLHAALRNPLFQGTYSADRSRLSSQPAVPLSLFSAAAADLFTGMALRSAIRKAGQPAQANVQAWNNILGQYGLPELVSCQSLHSSQPPNAKGRFAQAEQGKEQQAKAAKAIQKVLPEISTRPTRTPEELADAAARAKEYSRQCMRALRAFQSRQKERTKLRCAVFFQDVFCRGYEACGVGCAPLSTHTRRHDRLRQH